MQIPQASLSLFPFHLKATCSLHIVSICGADDTMVLSDKMVSLRSIIGHELLTCSSYGGKNDNGEEEEDGGGGLDGGRGGVVMPEGLGLSCSGLTPLSPSQCPEGKLSPYRLVMQQHGAWGNQSEHRDVWALLPALLIPGSSMTLFWCMSLSLMSQSKFIESLQPLVLLMKVARWVRVHSSVGSSYALPRIVVVAHVVLNGPDLAKGAQLELSASLVEALGDVPCELRAIFSYGPSTSRGEFAEAAELPLGTEGSSPQQLSVGEVETIVNELHASMSLEKLRKEYALVRSGSLCGILRDLSEVKGGAHPSSLASMVEVICRDSPMGGLHQSFQSADAICVIEDYIRSSVIQFRKEREFAPLAELEDYLNMAAQRVVSHLAGADVCLDSLKVDEATNAEVNAQVASASAATAQLENDRRHNEIHIAIKGLLDSLDVAAKDVAKCL